MNTCDKLTNLSKYKLTFKTNFGIITITSTEYGLQRLELKKGTITQITEPDSEKIYNKSELLCRVQEDILKYLSGNKVIFDYPLDTTFTKYQAKVFDELKYIQYGYTISYKDLATRVNTSPRAVARILASNPLPIVIPCHRVICANGNLGGYSAGIEWKIRLLKIEQSAGGLNF